MDWAFTTVSFVYLDTALLATVVAVFAMRRHAPGALPLAGLLFAAALWSAAETAESMAPDLATKILCSKISHLGIQALPVFFLIFSLLYAQRTSAMLGRRWLWLWLVPALAVISAATNDAHRLFWREVRLIESPFGPESVYVHGPLFWLSTTYLYLMIIAATVILVRAAVKNRDLYRRQVAIVLVAAAIPWLANGLYLSGANPLPGFDWTPLAFTVTGTVLAWAMYRFYLLDLVPIARTALFEHITDALLVTDVQGRVVDANPAAYAFFADRGSLIGRSVEDLLPPAVTEHFSAGAQDTMVIAWPGVPRQVDVQRTPLADEITQALLANSSHCATRPNACRWRSRCVRANNAIAPWSITRPFQASSPVSPMARCCMGTAGRWTSSPSTPNQSAERRWPNSSSTSASASASSHRCWMKGPSPTARFSCLPPATASSGRCSRPCASPWPMARPFSFRSTTSPRGARPSRH